MAFSPASPTLRCRNSEGAPTVTSAECAARSPIERRFHFSAVALVTHSVSASAAGEGDKISRSPSSLRSSASSTSSGLVAVASGSK
ncbi:Uncharacterised protein [Mycobacteroides abscessus subsp. abscessus]|nr:Uncharacterised protein [Mycobacteroides abscessus subsp. abscessus]